MLAKVLELKLGVLEIFAGPQQNAEELDEPQLSMASKRQEASVSLSLQSADDIF